MKKVDYAYLAGFFDGEGSICITKWRFHAALCVQLQVANTERWVLEWYKFVFGGNTYKKPCQNKNWKDSYSWTVSGKKAKETLIALLPYLKLKKAQAEIALEFLSNMTNYTGHGVLPEAEAILREGYRQRMAALNKRGK